MLRGYRSAGILASHPSAQNAEEWGTPLDYAIWDRAYTHNNIEEVRSGSVKAGSRGTRGKIMVAFWEAKAICC